MDLWKELEAGRESPRVVNAVVVTPKDSVNIYAYHAHSDFFVLTHVIHTPFRPPGDIGFIPRTYTDGSAPLDVIILSSSPTVRRTVVDIRPVALLRMTLDGVRADSVICAPAKDATMVDVNDVSGVNPHVLEEVRQFYESLFREQSRVLRIDEWLGADEARRAVERAMGLYKRRFEAQEG
ncbi:MAG: inorganic diphosphatase [Candidatus Aenigmarchaeota archaeon]|nr:inorganic diphosphatase [Candidatus Aenigmarchaeota archaeon]